MRDEDGELIQCERCGQPAIGQVHVEWTLFDWIDWDTCFDCYEYWVTRGWRTWVDRHPPVDVWITWWDVPKQKSQTHP